MNDGDVGKISENLLIKVARVCNPRGILRQDYIRNEIEAKYGEYGYGDLRSDVSEKTSGALKQLLMALLSDKLDFDAQVLQKAMKGFGTDEDCLITILCTLEEDEIVPLQTAYADRYERSLQQAVESETSGKFKRVLLLAGCDTIDEAYAQVCHSAISGWGTDAKALIRLMVTCSPDVMNRTREAYARLYGTDLVDAMSGEWAVTGDFKRLLCALAKKHPDNVAEEPDYAADVATLRDAVEGIGTDEAAIIDVLSCKNSEQIAALKEAYKVEHGEMLKERVKAETTGVFESADFRATLMGLLTPREEQIAFYLKEAFEGWANDDWGLISMLVHRTEAEMKEISKQYTVVHGSSLVADVHKNCAGDYEKALVALVAPRARTIARGIRAAMSGWISSTNKGALIALLTHRDAEMKTLREQFEKETDKSLVKVLKDECSGEFEDALVALASYTAPTGIQSRLASGEEQAPDDQPPEPEQKGPEIVYVMPPPEGGYPGSFGQAGRPKKKRSKAEKKARRARRAARRARRERGSDASSSSSSSSDSSSSSSDEEE